MKKLFFFLSFVFCLSFSMSAQATFLLDADAIDALKSAHSTLSSGDVSLDNEVAGADFNSVSFKKSSIQGMIEVVETSGNTEENLTQFFAQSAFSDSRLNATLLNETRDFIFSLITKEDN